MIKIVLCYIILILCSVLSESFKLKPTYHARSLMIRKHNELKMVPLVNTFSVLFSVDNPPPPTAEQVELVIAIVRLILWLGGFIYVYTDSQNRIKAIRESTENYIQTNDISTKKKIQANDESTENHIQSNNESIERQIQADKELAELRIKAAELRMEALFKKYFNKPENDE